MIINTNYGQAAGIQENGYYSFKNIPYARIPGRYLPAVAPEKWEGVRDCSEYGKYCPQVITTLVNGIQTCLVSGSDVSDEFSCLNLNVYAPAFDGKKRPVYVYLPHGAFIMGFHNDMFRHETFVKKYDCVVVTMNVRVGVLGYLQVDQYLGEKYIQSGNNGLLDAVMACRWIKENIAAFGGDADNITLQGESAGAMAIASLLIMPAFKGLVNKVIMQSGSTNRMHDLPTAHAYVDRLFGHYDINPVFDKQAAVNLLQGSLAELSKHWAEYQMNLGGYTKHHYVAPVFDGVTYPGHDALEIIRSGNFCSEVNILGGYCKDEYCGFLSDSKGVDWTTRPVAAEYFLNRADIYLQNLRRAVPEGNDDFDGMVAFCTDYFYANGIRKTYEAIAETSPETEIYFYRFDWDYLPTRAFHGVDLSFTRGGFALIPAIKDHPQYQPFADNITQLWANFIHTGNPNSPQRPQEWPLEWPRYTADNKKIYCLNIESQIIDAPPVSVEPFYMHFTSIKP